MRKPKWFIVVKDSDWSCRARRSGKNSGPLCDQVPDRAEMTFKKDGTVNERRYCKKHAHLRGCVI